MNQQFHVNAFFLQPDVMQALWDRYRIALVLNFAEH